MLGRGVPLKWGQKSKGWVPEPLEKTNQVEGNIPKGGAITSFFLLTIKRKPLLLERAALFGFTPFLLSSLSYNLLLGPHSILKTNPLKAKTQMGSGTRRRYWEQTFKIVQDCLHQLGLGV